MATYAYNPSPNDVKIHWQQPQVSNQELMPEIKKKNTFILIGLVEILIGLLCIILGVAVSSKGQHAYVGSGIWGGCVFIASGIAAIFTGIHPNRCKVLIGSLFASFAAIFALCVGITEAVFANVECDLCESNYKEIHIAIAAFSFVELVLALVHENIAKTWRCRRTEGHIISTTHDQLYMPPQLQNAGRPIPYCTV